MVYQSPFDEPEDNPHMMKKCVKITKSGRGISCPPMRRTRSRDEIKRIVDEQEKTTPEVQLTDAIDDLVNLRIEMIETRQRKEQVRDGGEYYNWHDSPEGRAYDELNTRIDNKKEEISKLIAALK